MLTLMRRMVGDAGHIERLYWAVKTSYDTSIDSERLQWRRYIEQYGSRTKNPTQRKKGLTMGPSEYGRSAEPHLAFAKELGLLEMPGTRVGGSWPSMGRWLVTAHAGRPFLTLWEVEKHQPPKYLLLALMLRHDRSFLIPFMRQVLKEGRESAPRIVAKIWENLWRLYTREMILAEPPLPRSLIWKDGQLKRTAKHHSDARLRFFLKPEGLNLDMENLRRLVEAFDGFEDKDLPSDHYKRIGYVFSGKYPAETGGQEIVDHVGYAYKKLLQTSHVSALGVFNYINELSLPENAVDWNQFLNVLRTNQSFSLHTSLMRGDVLFAFKSWEEIK